MFSPRQRRYGPDRAARWPQFWRQRWRQ